MIAGELLALLRCPETRQSLAPSAPELLARLEFERAAGRLRNRAGKELAEPIEDGLLREDGKRFYLVSAGLPILITEEGIDL